MGLRHFATTARLPENFSNAALQSTGFTVKGFLLENLGRRDNRQLN